MDERNGLLLYGCEQCSREYKTKASLKRHVQEKHKHRGDRGRREVFICSKCGDGRRFCSNTSLTQHIRRIHENRKPHCCSLCEKAYFRGKELENHVRVEHTGEKPFKCTQAQCSKSFASAATLHNHLKYHSGVKTHHCTQTGCGKSYWSAAALSIHMRAHTGEKPFSCSMCDQRFARKHCLNSHELAHTGEKPHSCTFCSYKCIRRADMEAHLRSHTGEKPYKCSHCGNRFTTKFRLRDHAIRHHTDLRQHACSFCDKKYASIASLRTHVHNKHLAQFTCRTCKTSFGDSSRLREHRKAEHVLERKFSCELCAKTCTTLSNLGAHMRTHTGEKPYKCDQCGKALTRANVLSEHIKTHGARVAQFACELCPASFHDKYRLKQHASYCKGRPEYKNAMAQNIQQVKELGTRTFFCGTCRKVYKTGQTLSAHLKMSGHVRGKRYGCLGCGKRYFRKNQFSRHLSTSQECKKCHQQAQPSHGISRRSANDPKLKSCDLKVVLPPLPVFIKTKFNIL